MRRLMVALAVSVAAISQLSGTALANGPGGWSHLGHGATAGSSALNGAVYALATDGSGSALYAGGAFTDAGGKPKADHLAKWNGAAWSALGTTPLDGAVRAIAVHAGKVYVGGEFTDVAGDPDLDFLAVWNGSSWSSPCSAPHAITAAVLALSVVGDTLYIGGSFANGAGIPSADFLLGCDLTTGAPSSTVSSDGDINSGVSALAVDSDGTLYAGGAFINLDGIPAADHVAAYSAGSWHAMHASAGPSLAAVDSMVRSLTAHGTDVFVGTDAVDIDGIAQADHAARWDAQGLAFGALGSDTAGGNGWLPTSGFIYALTTSGPLVFAAGSFQNANAIATADEIAVFNGTGWRSLGSNGAGNGPLNAQVNALATFHLDVCAGGNFTNAGGDGLADALGCYALLRPDARTATHAGGPFSGNDVYNPTGAGEAMSLTVSRGHSATRYVDIQNDGFFNDTFKVTGTGSAPGFTVTWFNGASNVTAAVAAGTFATGSLAPGAHRTLKMVIKVGASSASGVTFVARVTSPGTDPDAVKVVVHAS